jgi:CRP/FNR family transcriptional regulator, cyclic AMP receptor protein
MPEGTGVLVEKPLPEWLRAARTNGMLSRLPESLVATVIQGAQRATYPAGAVALRWDEAPKTAFVLSGTLRQFIVLPDGSQVTTRYLRAGDMSGVFAPRHPQLSRALLALEPCELLLIDGERMRQVCLAHPTVAWELIHELTTVLNLNHRALYLRAAASVRQRVVNAIVDRADASGGLATGQAVVGTQFELANAAGTVREVVASVLQALKRDGMVDVQRGRVVIRDPDKLAREAGAVFGARAQPV